MQTTHTAIIVYGALRSGTTMFRLMIDAHPSLACTGEHDFLFEHLTSANPDTARYDWDALENDMMYQTSGLIRPDGLDGAHALTDFMAQMTADGRKTPTLLVHRMLDRVRAFLPDAPIVHMLRDPRDVARSSLKLNFAGHVMFGADHWIQTEREWQRHGPADDDASLRLHYEDLAQAPQSNLQRFCDFIGVSFDPLMLCYDRSTTYEKPDASLVNQWRQKLSDQQIQLVEHRVGDLLQASGYKPSGLPPHQPGAAELARLRFRNRMRIWRTLVSRYGLFDPVARGLGRRLGLTALARSAQGRMDKVTLRYLQ